MATSVKSDTRQPVHLLLDLLNQVMMDPQSPGNWHRLSSAYRATSETGITKIVVSALLQMKVPDARTDFLRQTFLRDATESPEFAEQAAICLQKLSPFMVDRTAAFVAQAWGQAVKSVHDKASFISAFRQQRIPALIHALGQEAARQLTKRRHTRRTQAPNRVAILAPSLINGTHTPSVLVSQLCHVLTNEGIECKIYSSQEQHIAESWRFFGSNQTVLLPDFDPAYWQTSLPTGIELHSTDNRWSLSARWQNTYEKISDFDPDVILFCGLYSPLAMALYSQWPILGINVHAMPLLLAVDLRLRSLQHEEESLAQCWNPLFPVPPGHDFSYRMYPLPDDKKINRASLQIDEKAVVWISVGARLNDEVRAPWSRHMTQLLKMHPDAVWLLVGCKTLPAALESAPPGQIRVLPYSKDVGSLLGLSDIYINPQRVGGGFSVAEAMGAGLATLSLDSCDGGDKLGPYASKTLEDYVQRLHELTCNPVKRRELGKTLRERFDKILNLAHAGPSITTALEKTIELARSRLN